MKSSIKAAILFLTALGAGNLSAKNYIVLFKAPPASGIGASAHQAVQTALQAENSKNLTQLKGWLGARSVGRRLSKVHDLWLIHGAVADLSEDSAGKLAKEGWVHSVVEDKFRKFAQPGMKLQVGKTIKDVGDGSGIPWSLNRVGLPQIQAKWPGLDGTGVRVGIIDTGIQSRHAELKGSKVIFRDFVNNIVSPYDDAGHGTHVAGTIAGQTVGIAPNATLIVAKALDANGSGYDSNLLAAMQWMFDPDGDDSTDDFPQVVSNSYGSDISTTGSTFDIEPFESFRQAIQAWIDGGIVPVYAAGNSGKSPNGMPGGLPEPIAVGAIDNTDAIASFSSTGPNIWKIGNRILSVFKPDLSAPGTSITSCYPGNKYASMDGTSMATPLVAGSIALAMAAAKRPLRFAEVKDLLLRSVDSKIDTSFGFGILNTYTLISLVTEPATTTR